MPDHRPERSSAGRGESRRREAAAKEATKAREQASRLRGGPDAVIATEDAKRPTITLKTGEVVDARDAAAIWRDLDAILTVDPDEFRSLLALAQGRPADADPRHFDELWADDLVENDRRTIRPVVQQVLVNSYEETREGPVIAPLRLQNEADRPIAEEALRQCDQWLKNFATRKKGKGRSPD